MVIKSMNENLFQPLIVVGADEIREILAKRIDQQKQALGIVVGIIDQNGRRIVSSGIRAKLNSIPEGSRTSFRAEGEHHRSEATLAL